MADAVSASDVPSTKTKRSRREILAGAAGALGVLAAETIVRAAPARAANGDPVILGQANTETNQTDVLNTGGAVAFEGNSSGSGIGVVGFSDSGRGVDGASNSGDGVFGFTAGAGNALHGQNFGNGIGVFGEHFQGGVGVQGNSTTGAGKGVLGVGAIGVFGLPVSGGTGVVASTAFDGTGLGLNVVGPAQFALSGLVSIAAGAKSATVTGVSLRAGSLVLATVQNNAGVSVSYALPNVSQSKVTITLNKAVPLGKTAMVAWFVVN